MSGREILDSKARAAVVALWKTSWPLLPLWGVGLACGCVLPLGVALAGIDLLLAGWASVALGLYLGLRPGTMSAASTRSTLSTLAFFVFHGLLLWAALASPQESAEVWTWEPSQRWGFFALGLMVPAVSGATAWLLTRRTIDRFDEWVGRPCRAAQREKGDRSLVSVTKARLTSTQ